MADVNCVPEMLKLAKLIYDAWKALKGQSQLTNQVDELRDDGSSDSVDSGIESGFDRNMVSKVLFIEFWFTQSFVFQYNNFKTNQLTSEILQMGTQLFDILADEDANKVTFMVLKFTKIKTKFLIIRSNASKC